MQRITYPQITPLDDPDYPSCDGNPMADNTGQFQWITTVQGGIDALFWEEPQVVEAGDCLGYPVEGNNKIRIAPDTMVIFGRPKGHRGSYIQHREGHVPVHVTFEVLSPGNRAGEMRRKLAFYEQYGVEEYDILDPDFARHRGYLRAGDKLVPIADLFGWTSPRLGVRFELTDALRLLGPDGRPFETYVAVVAQRERSERQADEERNRADDERDRASAADQRAERARLQARDERQRAEDERQRANEERDRAAAASRRAARLVEQLRALGIEPED